MNIQYNWTLLRGIVALIMIKMPIQSVFPLSEYNTGNTVAVAATRTAYDIGATHTRRTVFNNNTKITALSLAASVAAVEVVACTQQKKPVLRDSR